MFIFVLFVIFMLVVMLSFFDEGERDEENDYLKIIYICTIFILTLLVGLRPIGIDKDSNTYLSYYVMVDVGAVELVEPSFHMISSFARLLDSPQVIFIVYALLAIPLKGFAISRLSCCWFLSLAVWFNNYFILHECTQIRAAVVTSIFLFAFYYLVNGRKRTYIWLILGAVFFHYSALILLPLIALSIKPINKWWRMFLLCAPIGCYAVHLMGIDPLTLIPLPFFQDKIEIYEMLRDSGLSTELNLFNMLALYRLGVFYFVLWKCDEIYKSYKPVYLMLKIMCISICCYAVFASIPAMAYRSSELFGVIDIFLMPAMMYAVKPEWVVKLVLLIVCIGLFTMNIFVNEYLSLNV